VTSLYPDIFYYAFLFSKKEASIIFSTKKPGEYHFLYWKEKKH
jgi:hypothetical protein